MAMGVADRLFRGPSMPVFKGPLPLGFPRLVLNGGWGAPAATTPPFIV